MSSSLSLNIACHRSVFQALPYPQQAYLLIEAKPIAVEPATGNSPVNLCLVLDRSGSMAGEKINRMRKAVKLIIDRLAPNDRISVVVFDDCEPAETVISCTPVEYPDKLKRKIELIEERGGTHLSSGLRLGLQQVRLGQRADRISGILLLTDGQTWEDQQECRDLADQCRRIGVPLYLLGLGLGDESNWDPRLLEELAERSGGEWMVIEAPEQCSEIFQKMLRAFQSVAATNARLTLRLGQGVSFRNVWRVSPLISRLDRQEIAEHDVQVFLGDIQRGVGQSILAELILPPRPPGTYRLGQAEILFDAPGEQLINQKVSRDVIFAFSEDAAQADQVDQRMMNLIERVIAHKLQTQALDEAALGEIVKATRRLRAVATRLLEMGESELAKEAENQASEIEKSGKMGLASAQKMRYATKRLVDRENSVPHLT